MSLVHNWNKTLAERRQRTSISFEQKMLVINLYEKNERTCTIKRLTGFGESTLRTIRANAEKIKQCYKNCASNTEYNMKRCRARPKIVTDIEKILLDWVENQPGQFAGVTYMQARKKALEVYEELKTYSTNPEEIVPFTASTGWFCRFKQRYMPPNSSTHEEIFIPEEDLQFPNITLNSIKEEIHSPNEDEYEEEIYQEESYPSPLPELEPGPPSPKLIKLESLPSETASAINSSPIEHPVIDTTFTEINNETPTQTNIELFTDNELDVTAKSIAMKMKKLTPEMRLHAEKLITDVLYYAQLGDLKRTSHVTP